MVVDDDTDFLLSLQEGLQHSEFTLDVFSDPIEALKEFKSRYKTASTKQPYDLLLLDVKMSKMSGFELYHQMKKIIADKMSLPPICFITAYEIYYNTLKESFPDLDVGCFISKPIKTTDLVNRLNKEISSNCQSKT